MDIDYRFMPAAAAAALGLLLMSGCGETASCRLDAQPDPEGDPLADTEPEPDADAEPDGPVPPACPLPIAESCPEDPSNPEYPPYPPHDFPVLIRASDLGPNARFVDVSRLMIVLAERQDAGGRTVVLLQFWDSVVYVWAELVLDPGSTLFPVAAAAAGVDSSDTALPGVVALLCDDAACALYGADLDPDGISTLEPVPGGEVPATPPMRGLWWELGPAACVFGNGIHCYDGRQWTAEVEADAEKPCFNAMEASVYDTAVVVAVGDRGRVARSGWPAWDDGYGEGLPDLLTVTCVREGTLSAGEGGVIRDASGVFCDAADEDIVFLDAGNSNYSDFLLGVTASGRVFMGKEPLSPDSGLCYTGQTLGPIVAAATDDCGILYHYLLMTADALYGTEGCAID